MNNNTKLIIFYDGKCILCFREIKHYKKMDKANLLKTIDITASDFDAKSFGLDEEKINISIHSMDEEGNIFVGVDTFAEIWKRVPPYDKLAPILKNNKLRPVFDIGYKVFSHHIRPRLPKRKCENETCEVMV
jgi:predicted DCC family thiol-disulfide oxidoreductase YuxK